MNAKTNAALEALKYVKNGQTIGLGTGSTAAIFIDLLAKKVKNEHLLIKCIPTSLSSKALAYQKGLVLMEPEEVSTIDVAIDGADCMDSKKNLIKGGGGAHTREKIIDYFAEKFIVIADETKFSKILKGPVPLELLPFAYPFVAKAIKKEFGIKTELRRRENGDVWKSDNGNFIADAYFKQIKNPKKLEEQLNAIPGIVENGIFSRNVSTVIIGYEKKVKVLN
ncbi:ribose-5-phosphate isomerase RpiA [Candidatus Micrarchaeota archaeon]|nr:ribose-5-phosphate isomerase RpiA [Candidatus Micrarchaeota archaeon]